MQAETHTLHRSALRSLWRAMPPHRKRRRTRLSSILTLAALCSIGTACRDETLVGTSGQQPQSRLLVGAAARALQPNGRFALVGAPIGELTEAAAVSLASAYLHDYARIALTRYEADAGRSINLAALRPCPRAYYATSAYESGADLPTHLARHLGPHWLVSFCDGSTPVVSVSLSALATDLRTQSGITQLPDPRAGDFLDVGIPGGIGVPPTPEDAVMAAVELLGARVTSVPELVQLGPSYSAQLARWRLTLERPVRVRGKRSGATTEVREVFVGFPDQLGRSDVMRGEARADVDEAITIMNGNGTETRIGVRPKLGAPTWYESIARAGGTN